MKQNILSILLLCSVLLLSSCASPKNTGSGEYYEKELTFESIIILPTKHEVTPNEFNTKEINALNLGAQTLTNLLGAYFINNPTITLLSSTQANAYLGAYIGNQLNEAKYIATQADADAVLISKIYRFRELDGKKYGADEPASVNFDYQLIHLESGVTLCRGTYDETQQTLLSNLFTFGKASRRKFKFVKGKDLLEEGLKEKFAQCSHLSQ